MYEIDPVEGGRSGGLARVGTLLTTLAGDYLSPSAIGTARVDGEPLAGRQMVDMLNTLGLDWATFGNHEFDVSETAFRARPAESKFRLVSTNVTGADDKPFPGVPTSAVVKATLEGELLARVLEVGDANQGIGGYLQTWGVRADKGAWLIQGKARSTRPRGTAWRCRTSC